MKKMYEYILGIISLIALILNTALIFIPFFILGLIKLIPLHSIKVWCSKRLHSLASYWMSFNEWFIDHTRPIKWQIELPKTLSTKKWYLVISNHQTWIDIPTLQKALNKKIPMIKPFIKDELKWVPLLGFAWWAIDMPFVKRYSKDKINKNPKKALIDRKRAQRSCQQFLKTPVSVMSFAEGTRFTQLKHKQQKSPYHHLLKPKGGGVSEVLNIMGERLTSLLDVTILYPDNRGLTFWDYLCGRVNKVKVFVQEREIPMQFTTTALLDPKMKQEFYDWLNQLWADKDQLISIERFQV